MKKYFLLSLFILSSLSCIFAQDYESAEIKFIKGNIQDKITSIREADEEVASKIAVKAVDFVLDNIDLLHNDRDIAGLAIAAILSYPETAYAENIEDTMHKFESMFYGLNDQNVKISVIDKMCGLYKFQPKREIVIFIDTYLKAAQEDKISGTVVEKKVIEVAGEIGSLKTFEILYSALKENTWKDFNSEIEDALITLSERSIQGIVSIIHNADFAELQFINSIFIKNNKISSTLKTEIAENLLTSSMILVRGSSKISKEITDFQLENSNILAENNWTRSSELMISYFEIAKYEYQAGFLSEKEYATVISNVKKISSKNAVKLFIKYLSELNSEMEKGNLPAVNVVSALISALGELGDKSAFDCLLFTTYLSYPDGIVAQARSALSSLKW